MIADAIRQARQMHRAAIEETYDGVCRIYEKRSARDPKTKITRQEEVQTWGDMPCRLSFSGSAPAADSSTVTTAIQTIKLFLAPEVTVKPGSRIEVTQEGRTGNYAQSGRAAVYASHQEIMLELWEERA